ncbi:hypothetical protein B0I37DRAFT_300823 [Chaetomium sp. MPI-CAGE-AT-0009]|nr:hypothetical protein B0I37DRAFT_300823 [Chaetomium sp. MPI-CAGE-AT-0009]
MGDTIQELASDGTASLASARVICEEFLKVLSRKEVEQPMIWRPKPLPLRPILAVPALPAPPLGMGHHQIRKGKYKGEGEEKKEKEEGKKDKEKKLGKLPPTAGYAGDPDLVDMPVYFCSGRYTAEDREAPALAAEVMRVAQLPPIEVVGGGVDEVHRLVDGRTLVYTVGLDCGAWREVLRRCKPAAVIGGGCAADSERDTHTLLGDYEEFKLDKARAPHTIGSSHLYIRRDIVEAAEREAIVPPYPVTFPHDYPDEHKTWYLDKLEKNGSGKIVRRGETS